MKHPTPPRRKKQGFTLIEMLIVVAIIAILVAVSIPLVNGSLERARCATDAANERAAKGEILLDYMMGYKVKDKSNANEDYVKKSTDYGYSYDAKEGKIIKGELNEPTKQYGKCKDHLNAYITCCIDDTETVLIHWAGGESSNTKENAHGYEALPVS